MSNSVRLGQFRGYIESRLTDMDFKLPDVARRFRVSDRYVRRVFECSHETVSKYLVRRRLELAARMLLDSRYRHLTILTIALECGFSGAAYFSRCFRNRFGTMPSAFRRSSDCAIARPDRVAAAAARGGSLPGSLQSAKTNFRTCA